jgi:hypothetical protein
VAVVDVNEVQRTVVSHRTFLSAMVLVGAKVVARYSPVRE